MKSIQVLQNSARLIGLAIGLFLLAGSAALPAEISVQKRSRVESGDRFAVREIVEHWRPEQTAIIVCDMWDAHHCLNAVRRLEELAPAMNKVLENARRRGVLIIHAPSSCIDWYKSHPARKMAESAPKAANLPAEIDRWCQRIPAEEKGRYPVDQSDGGEDDDPAEHARWHERLAGMGRTPKSPWKAQTDLLRIHDNDAISDSGVEIWNLLEHRDIRNVILMGVHTNMCVLGRPFGLRQMAKNGKNVVLMRDMTDSMYNPERWPYVTHYVGTERIIEHIEKYVCPTIASSDFLGPGAAEFRFKNDRRSIVMLIGDDEYKTEVTLPAFAKEELTPCGFEVRIVHAESGNPNIFPGMAEALRTADLVLVSTRRRTPPKKDLDALRAHLKAGKPLVGIRTANHAFALRKGQAPAMGFDSWPDFDAEVLGGHYTGHHGVGPRTILSVAPGAQTHPILRGIDINKLAGNGSLYKTAPLAASTNPLLVGTIPGHSLEPVAWTNSPRSGPGRVFYTSLGHAEDFQNPVFRKLLLNGICWTLELTAPGKPK